MGTDGNIVIEPPAKAAIGENVSIDDAPETLAWAVTRGGVEQAANNTTRLSQ